MFGNLFEDIHENPEMAAYGKIEEFRPETEVWNQYIERLEHYFVANETTDPAKQKSILLSVCGGKTYKLMSNLLAPVKPGDKSFDELKELIQKHHHPRPSEIVQRCKFNSRFREINETVAVYVSELRRLSEDCNFGDTLEVMLRDRLVCGINDDRIQRRLLSESELTFDKAMKVAVALEMAARNAADLQKQGQGQPQSVHKIQGRKGPHKGNKGTVNTGKHHPHVVCRYKDTECYSCGKVGHLSKKCPEKGKKFQRKPGMSYGGGNYKGPSKGYNKGKGRTTNYVDQEQDEELEVYTMFNVSHTKDPYTTMVKVEGKPVVMEIDTGASLSVISKETLNQLRDKGAEINVGQSKCKLKTYTVEKMPVFGQCMVNVSCHSQIQTLPLVVVNGSGPSLIGRDWLRDLKLDWANIFHTKHYSTVESEITDDVDAVLDKYSSAFKEGLGTVKGVKAKTYVDAEATPKYFKARPVPYAIRGKIEEELGRLEREGTIEPVQFSEWAAPIVPIVKEDQSIRICGDYKVTVNVVSKLDNYPIPKIEDLYATLSRGKEFTKLDLSQAYQQLELEDDSKKYVTINTHKGLYRYNRLPFGLSSAPGIFQRTMENLLQGLQHVIVRVDDMLITGRDREEHLRNLGEVLRRITQAGIRLKRSKCVFLAKEVVYLGHKVNEEGIQPVKGKVEAISEMPAPTGVKELQAYLGMLNFYHRFLPNLSTVLAPLHKLLIKDTKWTWEEKEQEAFQQSKDLLLSAELLVHFAQNKEIILSCDASPYGIGAVLSMKMDDGSERPVCYASRTLSAAEKNYSHLEKEGLSIVFGVKKFHQYLYGKHFILYTDHKPLLGLLKEDRRVPEMAAARIQRWALTLAAYEYTLVYREGCKKYADGLSRLPVQGTPTRSEQPPIPGEIKMVLEQLDDSPIKVEQVRTWTRKDPLLAKIMSYVKCGWPPKNTDAQMRPYYSIRTELSVEDDCLLRGSRIIIPLKGQAQMLKTLHEGHPGTNRMKSLARGHVWWPSIDSDIEREITSCELWQLHRKPPPEAPLHPWEFPSRPWERIHIDYAGPFMGKMFLVLIDSYSKWLEVFPMNTSTSTATIEKLRIAFATHGLPDTIVSDNGSCFTSQEFDTFMIENGIRHIRSAPFHPASNGMAERAVQVLKDGLRKQTEGTLEQKLARFLLSYRITPQTTGIAPCELLMGRKIKSKLDLVKPNLGSKVAKKQEIQKEYHDRHARGRQFNSMDRVFTKNFATGKKWLEGTILEQTGPLSYKIQLNDSRVIKRHVDHVRVRYSPDSSEGKELEDISVEMESTDASCTTHDVPSDTGSHGTTNIPAQSVPSQPNASESRRDLTSHSLPERAKDRLSVSKQPAIPIASRPVREVKQPSRFKDYVLKVF